MVGYMGVFKQLNIFGNGIATAHAILPQLSPLNILSRISSYRGSYLFSLSFQILDSWILGSDFIFKLFILAVFVDFKGFENSPSFLLCISDNGIFLDLLRSQRPKCWIALIISFISLSHLSLRYRKRLFFLISKTLKKSTA